MRAMKPRNVDEFGNPAHTDDEFEQDERIFEELVQLVPADDVGAHVAAVLDRVVEDYAKALGDPAAFSRDIAEAFRASGHDVDAAQLAAQLDRELRVATDSSSSRRLARIEEEASLARAELVRYWVNQLALASTLWGDEAEGITLDDDLQVRVPSEHREDWNRLVTEARQSLLAGVALQEGGVADLLGSLRRAVRALLDGQRKVELPSFLELRKNEFGLPVVVERGSAAVTRSNGGGTPPRRGPSRETGR